MKAALVIRAPFLLLQSNLRPAVSPLDGGNLQGRFSGFRVVSVENEQVMVIRLHPHRLAAGAEPASISGQQFCTATLRHRLALVVEVWPGDLFRAADHGSIGAFGAPAAEIPGNEEVIIAAVGDDEWGLDCFPIGWQTGLCRRGVSRFAARG